MFANYKWIIRLSFHFVSPFYSYGLFIRSYYT
jgi:hypothetical protein